MVVPEHLDWHNDTNEYFSAKAQMFKHQTDRDVAIYYADNKNSIAIASYSKGLKIPYFAEPGAIVKDGFIHIAGHDVCRTSELSLIGKHNWQNVCAAITTVWQITQDIAIIRKVLIAFTGLEHRLEYITEVNNVKYFDDSFGTTPETAIVAIEAFDAPKIVILGGSDKGASFTELAKVIKLSNVRAAMTIGSEGPKIEEALTKEGFTSLLKGGANMQEIVSAVSRAACPGDVVLLSPGCASFDMFTNYKERGDKFKQAVLEFAQDA